MPPSAIIVIVLSAGLAAVTMPGLAWTLPARQPSAAYPNPLPNGRQGVTDLLWLSGVVMFVHSRFELGIVLQGQQHANLSTQQVALMCAECSLVMPIINAVLFFHVAT